MVAGVDFDSFGVFVASLPFAKERDREEARFVTVRFRHRSRESGAEWAFETAKAIPQLLAFELGRVPAVAFIEHGFAPQGQVKHVFGMGRVQGLVIATLLDMGVVVNEMTPGEWRIGVAGKGYGNAPKALVHEKLAELFTGTMPDDENMRDALAMAWVGRELNEAASA